MKVEFMLHLFFCLHLNKCEDTAEVMRGDSPRIILTAFKINSVDNCGKIP